MTVVGVVAVAGASWSGFAPKRIDVLGNSVVSRDDILRSAAIRTDLSMWLQSTRAMSGRIEQLPYIESAAVHRVPPSEMVIVVTERVPLAVAGNGFTNVIVDDKLRVLAPAGPGAKLPAMLLPPQTALDLGRTLGAPAPRLAADLEQLEAAKVAVASVELDRYGGFVATLHDGMRVLFGDDDDLATKVRLLPPIEAKLAASAEPVAAIDLRAPATPVVVYK